MKSKKFTKVWALLLAMAMIVSTLAGCSGGDKKDSATKGADGSAAATDAKDSGEAPAADTPNAGDTSASDPAAANGDAQWDGEVSHIVVTYLTATSSTPADFQLIQDKVNEMTIPKIGVEVEFKQITVFEAMSQYSMWIGAGEQIDLMQIAFTDLQSYITQGMIEPLDELIAVNAPYLQKLNEDGKPIYDSNPTGSVYGIGLLPTAFGGCGAFMMSKEDLDSTGLDFKKGDLVSLDNLTEIFEKIKTAKPEIFPCGVTGKLPAVGYVIPYDALGATIASGVLIGTDSTTVENLYASDAYKDYIKHLRDWYEKGYILKDAATSEVSYTEYMTSGTISGYFNGGGSGLLTTLESNINKECTYLNLFDTYMPSISSSGTAYWTIPVTCTAPEAAMRFVNMLYEDADLSNLIQYGIKDKHYTVTDEENGVINYVEDSAYTNGLGLWGDMSQMYAIGFRDKAEDEEITRKAMANKTKGYGFCYDSSAMTNQIIAVQAVITEYTPALETGSAELEKTYEEFIQKLEANGINEIIADKQAQFDAWLAEQ